MKKSLAILVLLLGCAILSIGIKQMSRSKAPNACVVNFAKALGGKASFDLRQSSQKDRYYGIADISFGIFFICAGGTLLFKLKK
jgi:hypothetical protein